MKCNFQGDSPAKNIDGSPAKNICDSPAIKPAVPADTASTTAPDTAPNQAPESYDINALPPLPLGDFEREVLARLKNAGHAAYIVGGAVRDFLLGLPPSDYDFTTSATPDEVMAIFSDLNVFAPGLKHGTVCVEKDKTVAEITTFRTEGGYLKHRRPSSVFFTRSLEDDISRRDFTVNAICFDGEKYVDPAGGIGDIGRKIIRAIGDPDKRIDEDALRILRAVRLAALLNFTVDDATKTALFARKRGLLDISAERLRTETDKILLSDGAANALLCYREIFAVFIPELEKCFGFCQHSRYHKYDVFEHMARSVGHCPKSLPVRLAALLHDVAKPDCFTMDGDGNGHFYGHAAKSAIAAEQILTRLKYPNALRERVVALIRLHDLPLAANGESEDKSLRRAASRYGFEMLGQLIDIKIADNSAKTDETLSRIPDLIKLKEKVNALAAEMPCLKLSDLAVDGNDMIALSASGREIGRLLSFLLDKVVAGDAPNEKNFLVATAEKELAAIRTNNQNAGKN